MIVTLFSKSVQTSRRPVSSEKPDQLETTASDTQSESMHTCPLHITPEKAGQIASTPLSRMNECCIQTLMASRQLLERESRITGTFFSPLVTSPPLAQHDESSEASYTSPDCGKTGESLQGTRLQTPRAVLWTPKHSPAVCMNGTPVSQPKFVSNQKVSEPTCCARATQTDDMPFLQAPLQSTQTEDSHVSQQVQAPTVYAMCQTDYEDACERPRPVPNELPKNSVAEHVVDGSTLMDVGYQAETLLKPAGVQTTGSCCNVLERPQVADAAILCCMYSEQLVEYSIQTEPCHTEFRAAEPTKQEAVCEPVVLSDQLKKSAAVQADIWNTREMSLMEHRMDQYKKELQQRESEYKLQEKAAKKREIQLNAVIRQLKNKDKDLMVTTPCASSTAMATSSVREAQQPPVCAAAKPLGTTESAASLAQRLKAMTPLSREGARLIHFVQSRREQALEEEVQIAQRRASLSFKTQQLASAQRRQQAWAELSAIMRQRRAEAERALDVLKEAFARAKKKIEEALAEHKCPSAQGRALSLLVGIFSHPAGAEPRSPLREANQEVPQTRSPRTPRTPKDDTLDDTEYIPPMKFILDDLENLGSPL
ncbi:hypothetical protein HPB51_013912 [Rhipicephalus microplus]|uniref:Uncharacterized protein n=1 Tax=Rhipicephalus microplus TaxID=6941 RepID=A0A9J6D5E6_RHIMP|nr:hypothetical protein HPB51_013912 [Rhipicephalus microplus]